MVFNQYIYVNSKDRLTASTSNTDFVVDLNFDISNIKNITLSQFTLLNRINNINAGNNQFDLTDGSGTHAFTIPTGFYTAAELATQLSTQLNTVSAGYTVSFSTITGKFTFSNAGAFILLFSNTDNQYYLLGFPNANTVNATSHTSPTLSTIAEYIDLVLNIDIVKKNCRTSYSSNNSASFIICNDVNIRDEPIKYTQSSNFPQVINNDRYTIGEMKIKLERADNRTLYLDSGANFSFVLMLN